MCIVGLDENWDYFLELQASLVKDPGVSVNRVIWSPDGSLFGKLNFSEIPRD